MSGDTNAKSDQTVGPASTESIDGEPKRDRKLATKLAFGIGSAAIVAALLYAGRGRVKSSRRP